MRFLFATFLLFAFSFLNGQVPDSLIQASQSSDATVRVKAFNDIAAIHLGDSVELALDFAQRAGNESMVAKLSREEIRSYLIQGMANSSLGRNDFAVFYLLKSLSLANDSKIPELEVSSAMELSSHYMEINLDSSLKYCRMALNAADENKLSESRLDIFSQLGIIYHKKGDFEQALEKWESALEIAQGEQDLSSAAELYNNIGVIHRTKGDNQLALQFFQKNMQIQEELGDSLSLGRSLANIGNIYYYMNIDLEKARDYYNEARDLFSDLGEVHYTALILNNLGLVEQQMGNNIEAIKRFNEALDLFRELDNANGIAYTQNNLGNVMLEEGKYKEAIRFSKEALKIFQELGDQRTAASIYNDLALAYQRSGRLSRSLNAFQKAYELYTEMDSKTDIYLVARRIAAVYEEMGDLESAYQYFKEYSNLKDEVISQEYLDQLTELETKYETEKNKRELAEEKAIVESQRAELLRKNTALWGVGIGLVVLISISLIVLNLYRNKRRANLLLAAQNEEIRKQHDQIKAQKKEIDDSIAYASRIQNGLLPSSKLLDKMVKEHFIFYRPRNVVSGDFYWFTNVGDHIVIIAADCTGHGVPGAFMSILGISYLNEVINKDRISKPSDILETLRNYIICTLSRTDSEKLTSDGIDMSVITFNTKRKELEYAGAYNPLYIIRDGDLLEIKADRMPVGLYPFEAKTFTNKKVDIRSGDKFYLFSDGFADQFGGKHNKKFLAGKFKKLLLQNAEYPMQKQCERIEKAHEDWKQEIQQVDDILVLGIEF